MPLELIGLPYFSEEHARFLRAWLLHRLGRGEDALRWLEFGFAGTPMEVQYRAPTYLLRADILHAAGRRAEAVDYYGRFVRLWSDCDPGLRPTVEQARHELARLTSEVR